VLSTTAFAELDDVSAQVTVSERALHLQAIQDPADILLDKELEVVTATGLVYGINALGVVDILNQLLQLAGCISGQPGKASMLPEPGQQVRVISMTAPMAAGTGWPHGVTGHDMEMGEMIPADADAWRRRDVWLTVKLRANRGNSNLEAECEIQREGFSF